ncbi:unnamed protein product [Spodoptera littoralis]|uniref:acid phosphatase n=1 Tax=Spodoptera littoralis TaxID=7109 RepID=A0A9P0N864_SPOLI|nr:unnamed protein product [Spodoptera littoralis]CAH1645065.1 unnamed protein product [Spodoptera littoralis]
MLSGDPLGIQFYVSVYKWSRDSECCSRKRFANARTYRLIRHRSVGSAGNWHLNMELVLTLVVALVAAVCGNEPQGAEVDKALPDTKTIAAFVIFRHGDRTPDHEELALYPADNVLSDSIFFPYGKKALTNKGKQRSFFVGKYLKQRYDGLISKLYLPDEITIRTTDYARTKMTALTALAALYPPPPAQRWNPDLDWQPIPYNTPPYEDDDLLYWYNCPRYLWLRDKTAELPEIKKWIEPYQPLFSYLSSHTKTNITKPEDVFFLDNLFQTLKNVGVNPPEWAQQVMPKIKDVTKIEYALEFYNADLVRLASGVLMQSIVNISNSLINDPDFEAKKLYLYSGHENNVAGLMAAARVFEAHQPNYGSTFSLELRNNTKTGQFGMTAVYARNAGGPSEILPIDGCDGALFCDFDKFLTLVQDVIWSKQEMDEQCKNVTDL